MTLSRSIPNWTMTLLVLLVPAYAFVLNRFNADLYYLSVQEDRYVEWCTFWTFFAAAGMFCLRVLPALRPVRNSWFSLALASFCFFVAMEEISWGQRIVGFQPPAYFLANNYQQEFNLHNVADSNLRQWGMYAVLLGFGVLLPLAARVPRLALAFARVGIAAPPVALAPVFACAALVNWRQPLPGASEFVELMLGCCFVFIALDARHADADKAQGRRSVFHHQTFRLVFSFLLLLLAGVISAQLTPIHRPAADSRMDSAKADLMALAQDFRVGRILSRCGLDSRLYTFVQRTAQHSLRNGAFARRGPEEISPVRAEFFLDPWHNAYWVRDNCSAELGKRMVFIYSFGPNRRRDSPVLQVGGDDLAVYVEQAYP